MSNDILQGGIDALRTVSNAVLDFFGINNSVVDSYKRLGRSKYRDLVKMLNEAQRLYEQNDRDLNSLRMAITSESPLGIAYQKINNQIAKLDKQQNELGKIQKEGATHQAIADNSDIFSVRSNMEDLNNFSTGVENYFKENTNVQQK